MTSFARYSRALLFVLACLACNEIASPTAPLVGGTRWAFANASLTAPSNLTATSTSDSRADLGWQDNTTKENGFELYRSTTGIAGAFTLRATAAANAVSFADVGLGAATAHCYKVRAVANGNQTSAFSSTACATTREVAPTNAAAKPNSSVDANVTWTDNSQSEDGFRVERAATIAGPWDSVAAIAQNVTSTTVLALGPDAGVCYHV